MFQDTLIKTLKNKQTFTQSKITKQAMTKIEAKKRLSSKEFLKVHETIWQPGPKINYQNADNWKRAH